MTFERQQFQATVVAVSATAITVRNQETGKVLAVGLNLMSKICRDETDVAAKQLKVGDRISEFHRVMMSGSDVFALEADRYAEGTVVSTHPLKIRQEEKTNPAEWLPEKHQGYTLTLKSARTSLFKFVGPDVFRFTRRRFLPLSSIKLGELVMADVTQYNASRPVDNVPQNPEFMELNRLCLLPALQP